MKPLKAVPTSQLRAAAQAWRRHAELCDMHRNASGFLKFFLPAANMQMHDRVDELVEEIARLRKRS